MAPQAWIDGVEVSNLALSGSVTRRLNLPGQASLRLPMDSAFGGAGSRLKVALDGVLKHHGFVLDYELDGGEDFGYVVYNSTDPLEMWQWRSARDSTGDFSKPDFFYSNTTGPAMIQEIFLASENSLLVPGSAEGPLFLELGSVAAGGVDLRGAPTDFPMTMAQAAALLISTGEVDLVVTPIDVGVNMGRLDIYNGNYGTDRSGAVVFDYGMDNFNVRRLRWNEDMSQLCNKLWYYGGPRVGTVTDPPGDQHWCFNVTGDDTGLANPPGGDVNPYVPGASPLGDRIMASRTAYGVRMEVKIFDAESDNCRDSVTNFARELYRRRWQIESWIRAQPKTLVHVTPIRGLDPNLFDIGDLVTVRAGAQIKGGFSGVQRVYEYTASWEEDGVVELSELGASPNAEGGGF